jgi:hypothetical protein
LAPGPTSQLKRSSGASTAADGEAPRPPHQRLSSRPSHASELSSSDAAAGDADAAADAALGAGGVRNGVDGAVADSAAPAVGPLQEQEPVKGRKWSSRLKLVTLRRRAT